MRALSRFESYFPLLPAVVLSNCYVGGLIMTIDHIILAAVGVVGGLFGLYLLAQAKAYRARHVDDK